MVSPRVGEVKICEEVTMSIWINLVREITQVACILRIQVVQSYQRSHPIQKWLLWKGIGKMFKRLCFRCFGVKVFLIVDGKEIRRKVVLRGFLGMKLTGTARIDDLDARIQG